MYKNTVVLASAPQRKQKKKERTEERHKLWGEEWEEKSKIQNRVNLQRKKRKKAINQSVFKRREQRFSICASYKCIFSFLFLKKDYRRQI